MAIGLLNAQNNVFKNKREYMNCEYGYRVDPISGKKGSWHAGIDIIVPDGSTTDIIAIAPGKVIEARNTIKGVDTKFYTAGNYVLIDHGNGYKSRYLHLKYNTVKVKAGDVVSKGQVLGHEGTTGYSTGNHLHFEVWLNDEKVDPVPYLKGTKTIGVAKAIVTHKVQTQFKKGMKVKVAEGAKYYSGSAIPSFVYDLVFDIISISGDRAVIGIDGVVTGPVNVANLIMESYPDLSTADNMKKAVESKKKPTTLNHIIQYQTTARAAVRYNASDKKNAGYIAKGTLVGVYYDTYPLGDVGDIWVKIVFTKSPNGIGWMKAKYLTK